MGVAGSDDAAAGEKKTEKKKLTHRIHLASSLAK